MRWLCHDTNPSERTGWSRGTATFGAVRRLTIVRRALMRGAANLTMLSRKRIALACCLGAISGSLVSAPAALASYNETVFFEAPVQLLSAAQRPGAITQMQSLGVHAVRILLDWDDVAPKPSAKHKPKFSATNPADYNWGQYTPLLEEMHTLGWKVLLTVTGPVPCWASSCAKNHVTSPNAKDFGQFMEAVGREYGSYVKLYSVWNEPNQPQFLMPQYKHGQLASPAIYRQLFLDGYAGLKASGNFHGMTVLMGETSPVGVKVEGIPAPLAFLRGVLCLNASYVKAKSCGKLPAGGYAQHPYTVPTDPSLGVYWTPPSADDVTISTLGRLTTALNRAAAAGAINANLPIYVTEFGVQSKPNRLLGVSVALQAEYDAIAEHLAWENPRVVSFDQYLLVDDSALGFQSGLEYHNGKHKPVYNGWRLPLTVTRYGAKVAFWGLARPSAYDAPAATSGATAATGASGSTGVSGSTGASAATSASSIVLEYSADGGHKWKSLLTVKLGSRGYWTAGGNFVARRLWRVQWTAPSGTVYVGATTSAFSSTGKPQP